ncbi:cysteine dioxygenase [Paludisphaera borealis]|uniref:Cysteine dioxygenase n=1 Tax=Paludisphaera borealis TaxID=1387353 RepID=A0A1U7CMW4_9BACT|nr:cysteine dioxygenase family protein [Paludisphaera borealis]APW60246.1 Cysteine dioxygenase [Paludisphaera borealis]
MSTRHNFQTGHAPSWFRPRIVRTFDAPPDSPEHEEREREPERVGRPATVLAEGRTGLHALLKTWDRLAGPIPEDWIRDGLRSLRIDRDALWDCVHFHERTYQRTRIHAGDQYEVLVLCWRPGQGSPIHDHGGSTSGVLVVEGVATEIAFMATACDRLAPSRSQRVHAGAVVVSRARDVRQITNLEPPGTNLVSLHVYSPPLTGHRCYRLSETIFADHDALLDDPPVTRSAPL